MKDRLEFSRFPSAPRSSDREAEGVAREYLDPGERLLWAGRPDPRSAIPASIGIFVFAIPWTAFALFWMWGASGFGAAFREGGEEAGGFRYFFLFGLPFVLIGIGMLLSPLWIYRKARSTVYAVSDRRLLITHGEGTRSVHSLPGRLLGSIEMKERRDGRGDLVFQQPASGENSSGTSFAFHGVGDVRAVERLIRGAFNPE
jgi:hypothetical protein